MFVGHYSAAFAAKAMEPRVPLWVLLLAAQLVDVFWAIFVLLGIEAVRLDPTLASNALDLHHMPYTHSLVGAAAWAGLAGFVATRAHLWGGTYRAGIVVGLVVLSHWFLDLFVHRPDLTLWGAPPKLGFGLWDSPIIAYSLELAALAGCAAFYALRLGIRSQRLTALGMLVAGLVVLQTTVTFGAVPTSIPLLIVSMLGVFAAVAYAGARAER